GDSTGERTLYWVRGTSSGAYTTAPVIKRAWTDILLFQYLGDISTNDQTFVITSEAIRLSEGSIQIDVPNRYRAIMETGDTQDYILFYDRAQSDSSPNPTHEIVGPHIVEATVRYLLRWDASRTTTILESSSVRVKIRVEGCFDTAAGGACLTDGTDKITVVEDYTFTTEGMFVETMTDFRSTGITLDTAVGLNGYDWLGVYADVTDAAFDDTATPTILYGDGSTESNTSTDGAVFEDSNKYVVLPGTGSDTYQDAFVGVMRAGWYDDTGGSDTWAWDENNVISGGTTQDLITTREQDHLTIGKHYAKWFFLMLAEDDLDTEAEREGYINDFRNPDILDFTTGSEWNDAPASPGLKFPSTLGYYTECGLDSSINDLTALTWEAWIYVEAIDATNRSIFYKNLATKRLRVNATTGYLSGFIDYTDTDAEAVTTTAIPTKQWVHVTMTWSTADNIVRLFQNGVNVATSGAGVGSPGSDALSNLRFGANFYGVLDEGRMWSTVRSASDLQQNMYKELTGNESNLVGYWKVDENTGTTHYDETSNNNDCTLYGTPTWTTGFIPDHYNEAEGVYTVEASGSQVNLDIDGGANASTAVATTAVVAGVTSITVGSTTGFPTAPSVAYIDGDKFSYTGTTATTFTGIPASGELSVIGHAIGTVVSSMNRHKPMYKIRKYQLNDKPSSVTMEGSGLTEGTDYNVDYVPISDAYFADELLWYSSCESISAISTPDVGTTYSTATIESDDIVPGKYGNGFRVNASDDEIEITDISSNFDQINGSIEFWFKPNWSHTDGLLHHLFRARDAVTGDYLVLSKENAVDGNDLFVYGEQGAADYFHTLIAPTDYSFTAGEWVHLRVTWDSGASSGETLRIFINGQEPTHSHNDDFKNTFDIDNGTIYFDNTNISDHADGIYDEIMIFGGSDDEPTTLAQGGNTADSSEYLFSEAQDYTLDFVPVDASNRGEYVFFSADSMFSGVNVDLETAGATGGTLNLDWEYWNGTAWASLESITGFTDGTSNLTQDGAVYWTANPTNWRKYSVNGSTDLYYIRASLNASSGTYTTSPVENLIRTDMLILQYLANVASTDQTLVVIPERLWLLMSVVFFVPGALRKKRKKHKMVK
ncbi:LamG domain-containing protein, partial [Patescibacteria group bacterium]|nr:LamG domain-containing protein [Patescibacteria group bacterium]